jgi:actin-related protein
MYSGGDSLGAIVVDAGSYSFRVGYAGDDFPRAFVRSSFGEPVATGSKSQKSPNLFDTDLLSNSKENVVMCNPMRDGLIYDWDHFEKLWEYCLTNYVKVDCSETPVLMAEKSYNTPACRHKYVAIVQLTLLCVFRICTVSYVFCC